MDAEVLAAFRGLATTAGLVRLTLRRARPTQRLRLLRYLETFAQGQVQAKRQVIFCQRSSADFSDVVEAMTARLPHPGSDSLTERLAHICAVKDFFTTFEHDDREANDAVSEQEPNILAARAWNEGRLQLAMEVGIQPLFVDDPGVRLAESGYVRRAKALGYAVSFDDLH